MGDPNAGSSSLFPGMAGGATGYLGPGLHGNQAGMDGGVTEVGQGAGGSIRSTATAVRKHSRAVTGAKGVEDEWDATQLGGGANGEDPLSPRNREYRRKMIEMNAEHRVRAFWPG